MPKRVRKRPQVVLQGFRFAPETIAEMERQRQLREAAKALQPPTTTTPTSAPAAFPTTSATPANPTRPAALPPSPIPGDDGQAKAA